MSGEVVLLSRPINFAVVQLPSRSYPGVVLQGDTLNGLVQQMHKMSELLKANQLDALAAELGDIHERLTEARSFYESVCAERGITLPYAK